MSSSGGIGGGGGPCGACKFLRRKCVKGCVFAPYFDSDQGTAHFAAVHKVFGASNASKLLTRIPPHKRLDAVVTLCYEALARVRDPVYGCVGHIFTLQQQVVNLQAELAYVQARLSTMQHFPLPSPATTLHSSTSDFIYTPNPSLQIMDNVVQQPPPQQQPSPTIDQLPSFCNNYQLNDDDHHRQELDQDDGELQSLAREFVSRYLPGVRVKPSGSL
ncbi:hypothetical protein ACFE04_016771 [Oxalis oulophora]